MHLHIITKSVNTGKSVISYYALATVKVDTAVGFGAFASLKGFVNICLRIDAPIAEILVKVVGIEEHVGHGRNGGHVPFTNELVKFFGKIEHVRH